MRRLDTLAWPDIPAAPVVFVPLGATEQHGPHLPFDTDTVIAEAVSTRLDAAAIVAPVLAYGSSGEHQDFPGTISIGHSALRMMLVELVRSTAHWAGRVIIVNGHGGNIPCLSAVVPELIAEGHDVAWLPCATSAGDAHAGVTETSIMLHLAPDRVRLDRAEGGPENRARASPAETEAIGGQSRFSVGGARRPDGRNRGARSALPRRNGRRRPPAIRRGPPGRSRMPHGSRMTLPLPLGFVVELNVRTRVRDGGRTLIGGSPTRLLYLSRPPGGCSSTVA